MQNILDRLSADPDLDRYYTIDEEESAEYHAEILQLAKQDFSKLKDYCLQVHPKKYCALEVIYWALSEDEEETGAWADFLYEEFVRIFEGGKKAQNSQDYMKCLEQISIYHDKNQHYYDKMVQYAAQQLDHPKDAVKYVAMTWIYFHVHNDDYHRHILSINKMKALLRSPNWKLRWHAHDKLKSYTKIPKGDIGLSIWDRIQGWLGNPYEIED